MQKTQNLQDIFLNQARRDKSVVTMFLMNGFQLHGIVRGYDSFTEILQTCPRPPVSRTGRAFPQGRTALSDPRSASRRPTVMSTSRRTCSTG